MNEALLNFLSGPSAAFTWTCGAGVRLPHPDTLAEWEATEEVVPVFGPVPDPEPGSEEWLANPDDRPLRPDEVDDDGFPL